MAKRKKNKSEEIEEIWLKTRDLFLQTIAKAGIDSEQDEDYENSVWFSYQGSEFHAIIYDGGWMSIVLPCWKVIDLYDLDLFPPLRVAINRANNRSRVSTFYLFNEEEGLIKVFSSAMFYFIPEIPDLKKYLRELLDSFFETVHEVELDFDRRTRVFNND